MKKIIVYSIVSILIFSCADKKPKLVTSEKEVFLDSIGLEETKTFSFTIYNRGNADLKILSYTCSCDCTVPELKDNQVIVPNDSFPIKISVKPKPWDAGKPVGILCTFKTNADSVFTRLKIGYFARTN